MSRGIGQLQRKILAFAYATNKVIHGGEYKPPPGILKPYPETCRGHGQLYVATNATGDLHAYGAMAHIFGLERQNPKEPWWYQTKKMLRPVLVSPGLGNHRSWAPKDDPRWSTARSATLRAIANLRKRLLLAYRYQSCWQSSHNPWGNDDRKANAGLKDRHRFKFASPESSFNNLAREFLTPAGVEVAKAEPVVEMDFKKLFGFDPEALFPKDE